jgi:hypothetical protein
MKNDLWWLEYVEGEMDSSTDKGLKSFLEKSKDDQKFVSEIESLKSKLKVDPVESEVDLLSEDFFQKLHDKIMARVDHQAEQLLKEESLENQNFAKLMSFRQKRQEKVLRQRQWLKSFTACVAFVLPLFLAKKISNSASVDHVRTSLLQLGMEKPNEMISLVSHESSTDFYADIAYQSHDDLSLSQLEQLMGD